MEQVLKEIAADIDRAMIADRQGFARRLGGLRRRLKQNKPADIGTEKLRRDLDTSLARVARRRQLCPGLRYPEELPISTRREDILAALDKSQVVVVAGETGSGKTTQLPKLCLELGRGAAGMIGHTQPRRIAARTVADRIAEELGSELGDRVGYQVRFADQSGDNTLVKLMTDGILLAEIQGDPLLTRYDTLIIDEAHERSLNIDFLLGYIKQILPKRPDLKVIITSATIDVARFSAHFSGAPVIEVSGRTYPVEVRYRPPVEADDDITTGIVDAVDELLALPGRGDILVFLSGEREIREAGNALRRSGLPDLDVLPLYARLSMKEQTRIFHPPKGQRGTRVVLATNVAETSLTVPGIRYVVDTGYARISRYSYRTKVQRLPIEPIAQASANQRAGRCGRVSEGVCIRLYSEEDFLSRPAFTDPEIVRTNLAAVILRMLQMRIGDIRDFPFVDPPDRRLINDGFQLLAELGAVDDDSRLTDLGRELSRLPVDPRLGRMLVAAGREGALREVMVMVSALSIQDPRERPADKRQAADQQHREWLDRGSDFQSLLNLWQHFEEQRQALSRNQFSRYCHSRFVSYRRMREWRDLHHQLHLSCRELRLRENREPAGYQAIHRALLSGLLSHVGFRHDEREYLGARNRKFHIFPGSGLFKKPPKWVMAGELLETSRLYAHQVARIEPEWLVDLAAHLVRKSHSEPHYDARRGQVMAYEKQTLFGLTILDRKRVPFASIDPVTAREVFIQGALVEDRYRGKGEFARHNRELLAELEELEDRLRRRDILVDDRAIHRFYDRRVPADIAGLKAFEKWRNAAERDNPRLLYLDRDALVDGDYQSEAEADFPTRIHWDGIEYPLSYRFEPGHPEDGVSVRIPMPILHQVPKHRFEWLVPGLLRDKCIALVKGLPKQLRKQFVPVPDYVDKALAGMTADNVPLTRELGHQLKRHTALDITPDSWQEEALEDFYRANFQVLDENDQVVDQGRDLEALKARYQSRVQETIAEAASDDQVRAGITAWDFGDLESRRRISRGELEIDAFPALVDEGDSVALQLVDSEREAAHLSRRGLTRLLILEYPQGARYLRKQLFKGRELALVAAGFPEREPLVEAVIAAAYRNACLPDGRIVRSREEFRQCLAAGKSAIAGLAADYEALLDGLLPDLKTLRAGIAKVADRYPRAGEDMKQQQDYLFRRDFLLATDDFWLRQYPRYIKAAIARLEKLPAQEDRDRAFTDEMAAMLECWRQWHGDSERHSDAVRREITRYRFMLEEYRVSVFAQVLKTVVPVSARRIAAQGEKVEKQLV